MRSSLAKIAALIGFILTFSVGSTALASDHDEDDFKITGVIESLPNTAGFIGDWRVSGRTIHVTSATRIEQEDGRVAVGVTVKVEGTLRSDNSVDAIEIEVKERAEGDDDDDDGQPTFKGTIEILPNAPGFIGDWRVGGRTIHVTAATKIETEFGPVAVGAFVEIKGTVRPDGSIDATKIETKSNVAGGDGRDEFKGMIESLPAGGLVGDWKVKGRTVHVTSATVIDQEHGRIAVGAVVEVSGTLRPDGSLDAARIEVRTASDSDSSDDSNQGSPATVKGTIQSLPPSGLLGDWTVAGRLVHVVSSTKLKSEHGAFAVGVTVKLKGLQMSDGSIVATKVSVRDSN
ncbi:MAG TPA: DUF5666 domain-containing protein [Blastocatellia bacterium]|nr:DUF5666 domain-containing protein [Blastocatellia bacterium]